MPEAPPATTFLLAKESFGDPLIIADRIAANVARSGSKAHVASRRAGALPRLKPGS
jgi:hypothetical protein